ncbi:hypothetical protein N9166_00615 [bacterium]|nr:hypothetical protein [bacterium]
MSQNDRVLFGGVFAIALGTLLYEVALIRVFSYTIWHHFGYVTISTALLGFGASGTFLAVRPATGRVDLRRTLALCCLLAAASGAGMLALVAVMPLHPMSILESPGQAAVLVLYQVGAAVPFFFSGLVISLALRAAASRVDRLYFWDLLGAGLGCAGAVVVMNQLGPPGAVLVATAAAAAAGAVFASARAMRLAAMGLSLALLVASAFASEIPFTVARTKELAILTSRLGMAPRFVRWTALFRTDVVEDPGFQEHRECEHWGNSVLAPEECEHPRFWINHDGTAGTGIYDLRGRRSLAYMDYNVLHLPYLVANRNPDVLVIGVGGGRDVVNALQHGAAHVTGVDLDPMAVELLREEMNEISDGWFRRPEVVLVAGEGRHFVSASNRRFDLIQLTGVDTLSAEFSGSYVLAENYLYTVEAFHDYLDHLEAGGILSFAMGNLRPDQPRAAGRIVSVAQRALRERGIERPQDHIAVVGSNRLYAEVMIRREPFDPEQVGRLQERAAELRFKPLLLPGREAHPVFRRLVETTGKVREQTLDQLRFVVSATTDDRPFFFSFFRWTGLFEPGRLTPSHATALGQIVLGLLAMTLTILGGIFVLGPLLVFRRRGIAGRGREPVGILIYFLAVGLGFMFFEISLIQRFVLFLGYPTYSLSVTLFTLLVFLGWGSFLSRRWVGHERVALPVGVAAILALTVFYMTGLTWVQNQFLASPIAIRVFVTVAVLAPLGLVMGMFFPLGIRRAQEVHSDLVPWAWGVNGCASVTGGVLAVVLAMSHGFTQVWLTSVAIYALGVAALLGSRSASSAKPQ